MKNTFLALMAAAGIAFSAGAQAGQNGFDLSLLNGINVATASAELVCEAKSSYDKRSRTTSSRDLVAKSGNFSLNINGLTTNDTLQQILDRNQSFVDSVGSDKIPCTAAVAEVQRYVAAAFVYNIVSSFGGGVGSENLVTGVLGVIASRLITATPTVTNLDDDKVLYNWVVALPDWTSFFTPSNPT